MVQNWRWLFWGIKPASPGDGLARWTTAKDKVYDSKLFRNGGFTYWEEAQVEPYTPLKLPNKVLHFPSFLAFIEITQLLFVHDILYPEIICVLVS